MFDQNLLNELETGKIRVVDPKSDNQWVVNISVKEKILQSFKQSVAVEMDDEAYPQYRGFIDKAGLMPRRFAKETGIRIVPGGTAVRSGAYIGRNVVIMPPSYVNIGAYIDDETLVDSHVLVGSCAQVGKRVHLSTGVQIGGVLEPIGNCPVIIEDDCFIGAGVILTEGILVREKAVIAPGVVLSGAVPIYDSVKQKIYKGEIPKNAVVVPGTRPSSSSQWGREQNLSLQCAIIIKYRDDKTEKAIQLEECLRESS